MSEGIRVAINAPWKLVEVGGTSHGIAEVEEGGGCVFGEDCSQVELGEEERVGQRWV